MLQARTSARARASALPPVVCLPQRMLAAAPGSIPLSRLHPCPGQCLCWTPASALLMWTSAAAWARARPLLAAATQMSTAMAHTVRARLPVSQTRSSKRCPAAASCRRLPPVAHVHASFGAARAAVSPFLAASTRRRVVPHAIPRRTLLPHSVRHRRRRHPRHRALRHPPPGACAGCQGRGRLQQHHQRHAVVRRLGGRVGQRRRGLG